MSDAFADLWNSTPPVKPSPPPLASVSSRPRNDAFTMLSSAGSSAPNSRPLTPSSLSMKPVSKPPAKSSGDAFSSLLSDSFSNTSNNTANMTMAERKAHAERERQKVMAKAQPSPSANLAGSTAWDGLDSLGQLASSNNAAFTPVISAVEDDWGLGDFASPSPSQRPAQTPVVQKQNIWDVVDFDNEPPQSTSSPQADDDVLGLLGRPINEDTSSPAPQRRTVSPPSQKSPSPPPHILGQIVEMGFSVSQAKTALAATETGLDVEAALEILISNGAARPSPPVEQTRSSRYTDSRQNSRAIQKPAARPDRETPSPSAKQDQFQADKLLAQAGEFGLSLFNRMKESSKRVQQAYLENFGESSTPPDRENKRKVPKWMQQPDSQPNDDHADLRTPAFVDDDSPPPSRQSSQRNATGKPVVEEVSPPPPDTVDLFSATPATEPTTYVSPFRRGKAKATDGPSAQFAQASRRPSPQPRQNVVSASQFSISQSQQYKTLGGERFKLGQYGDAETAYTQAIDCLPSGHLLLVHLYNNRALARIRTGDNSGAISDAGIAIDIIGENWRPGREAPVTSQEEGVGVDLGDGLVKAWKRRAEALEGKEKWEDAQKDWEKVAGADWTTPNLRTEGVRGAGRCRRMVNGPPPASSSSPKPPSRPAPRPRVPTPPSRALNKLRAANDAAEAEDQAKHELKDSVESKILAWKGGKETNIRGLLASLDMVLWPELGLPKSSMADLVTPNQVKIRYQKTIGRLHPDKLNEKISNLEQRMLAAGVFGTLNEAWNAFKP